MKKMTSFMIDHERPIDVICMGRVAVDLYSEQIHHSLADAQTFRKYLGGCAGNIAVGTARLGLNSMMFSCIGKDEMGQFLKETLQKENVSVELLYETEDHLTGLVLLGIDPPHHFPLIFYRKDCADMQLKPSHVNPLIFAQSKTLLITGTALSTSAMRETTHHAVKIAREVKTRIILDIDFRPVLWGLTKVSDGETRYLASEKVSEEYQKILPLCDLIVGTEEECRIASGKQTISEAIQTIRQLTQAPIVLKMGEKGCCVYFTEIDEPFASKPFPVEVLNVLGAGDAFMSGLLRGLLTNSTWEIATTYANASGALVVTRHGCAPAMPDFSELTFFMSQYENDQFAWKSQRLAQLHEQVMIEKGQMPVSNGLIHRVRRFSEGLTSIVKIGESLDTGMNFSCLKLRMGEHYDLTASLESAYLLMTGKIKFNYASQSIISERIGYFEQDPIVLHCCTSTIVTVEALTDCELLMIQTKNEKIFEPILFDQHNLIESDHRGKNLLENTAYRIVRTVFDKRNRPDSNLVLGEIITFQGHWSSYPPHYHAQAEVYHYRFSEPEGFAFGENGNDVLRIRHYDTYKIINGQEHAHCTAPGYALYTLWFIRHLPNQPYYLPTFRHEHEWTRYETANRRAWKIKTAHYF